MLCLCLIMEVNPASASETRGSKATSAFIAIVLMLVPAEEMEGREHDTVTQAVSRYSPTTSLGRPQRNR